LLVYKSHHACVACVQKERQLQREVQTLRSELNKKALHVTEALAAQRSLQERVQALQREANEKDGLYHAKCKELSVAKLRGGPSGIGALLCLAFSTLQERVMLEKMYISRFVHMLLKASGCSMNHICMDAMQAGA
jgi:hypothetical protein